LYPLVRPAHVFLALAYIWPVTVFISKVWMSPVRVHLPPVSTLLLYVLMLLAPISLFVSFSVSYMRWISVKKLR